MLIAYDGSEQAGRAIEYAARMLKPATIEVLTAWEPVARQAARAVSPTGMHQPVIHAEEDPAYEEALRVCREGVAIAEAQGLTGHAHLVECTTSIGQAIVDAAKELDVDVIVAGTRAISGLRSLWSSSTADHIVRNAGLPVFIVPPEDDADTVADHGTDI